MKIERIVIAIDASSHSLAALDAAAALASMHDAELTGIFVEDINLLRLAQLPFARELLFPVAMGRQIDRMAMEQSLKEIAEKAREALSDSASRMDVKWDFRLRRGSVLAELISAAKEASLMAIGKASQESTHRVRMGAIASHLLVRSPCPVLAMGHGEFCQGPALLVADDSPACEAALPGAVDAARLFGEDPVVVLMGKTREEASVLKEKLQEQAALRDLRFRRCSRREANGLSRVCHEEEAGAIVLAGLPAFLSAETLPDFLARIDCPVLLFRY